MRTTIEARRTFTAREDRIIPHTATRSAATAWSDLFWWSADGVRLHARDYPAPVGAETLAPILCLPGLMRNARDFEDVAPELARHRRTIVIEFRGRGDSGHARDAMTYTPLHYMQDVLALMDEQGIARFATVGTSLGGLVSMLIAAAAGERLIGAVLNDVGPQLSEDGLARVRTQVGASTSQPTWMHAARAYAANNGAVYPGYDIRDWLRIVHRTHRLTAEGRIVADYDKQIAVPLRLPQDDGALDLWPAYRAFDGRPLLILRGALSDILLADAAARMTREVKEAVLVEVPGVGHAPTLDEPAARAAIAEWIMRLPPQ